MIPKKIHYCWFGGNEKSEKIKNCIKTWEKHLTDYHIIEWNETNFDVNQFQFTKEAYENKKWAFVSDYVRAYALYTHGGIYLDTDVEITGCLDDFLVHGAFSGFETKGYPFTALWGAQQGHHWPKEVLDFYGDLKFDSTTNTVLVSKILEGKYGIDPQNDSLQIFNDDLFIYPSHYFCLNIPNFAIHHFEGSWVPKERKSYSQSILFKKFIVDNFTKNKSFDDSIMFLLKHYNVSRKELIKYLLYKIINYK